MGGLDIPLRNEEGVVEEYSSTDAMCNSNSIAIIL